ncbi:biotin--[acetyl-CoA-carboxylase] ligase [Roseibium denhamense]|uniref:biotin--[biotin carboxyl-carrier protein] ligase n=1 Tax=Roseibium denhamense TaxID=76305 RepID=A0ABY1PGH4_9HYPH|nr:biotin--[acetyl-CoA-carboxylase] ligase [Roseibium denhamense]MTI06300.1 biotin--[acetyl-CoA-carboxylase] ligase [Roseibium denhamense]SMP33097.1 BirA family transcriptional regulator, biotin operon repressor / biotin-[acetyl-CoA-carboxylase] ligase [Roseibium denhamense]
MDIPKNECPAPGAPGFRLEHHAEVGSSNTLAFDRARAGDAGRLWIRADIQTAGRGRRGRDWDSPNGNLFASLLLINPEPRDRIGELPLLAAVALAEAVDKAAGTLQLVGLKWPNDLLVEGAKLSGILLEAETLGDGRLAVVLGIGVNCMSHPPLSMYQATDLRSLGFPVAADRLFECLTESVARHLAAWQGPGGFEPVRRAWLKRAAHIGKEITVRTGHEEVTGIFTDLDTRGHLVLKLDDGRVQTIYAGDVFLAGN